MFRKITFFSLFLAVIVIALTAYTRLSGAQLACPDWPTCYGQFMVGDDADFVAKANQAFPGREINLDRIRQVLGQRYLETVLVLLSIVLSIAAWREKHCRLAVVVSSLSIVTMLGMQAAANAWLAKLQGMPVIALIVVLLPMVVVWLLFWQALRSDKSIYLLPARTIPSIYTGSAMLILFLQLVLGIWISVNHAALACQGFPQCNGQWWPEANYQAALDVMSGLFSGYTGDLAFTAQIAVNWLHRLGALIGFIVLTAQVFRTMSATMSKPIRKAGVWLSLLLFVQIATALLGIKLNMPVELAVIHQIGAVLLMLPVIAIGFYSRYGFQAPFEPSEIQSVQQQAIAVPAEVAEDFYVEPAPESLYLRLRSQLKRTRSGLGGVLAGLAAGQKQINRDLLEEIETSLLTADIGINATTDIIVQLTQSLERHQLSDGEALSAALKQALLDVLKPCSQPLQIPKQDKPFVILVVGVNGAGKTTTIGKLAKRLQSQGYSVMLAAGDTFRAAAVEQLQTWGERNKIQVVAQHTGADSASVIYDGVQSAQAKGIDVLIADTAGRLHTKSNLMDELKKVKRIMAKLDEAAPHEVLLVLDAGTGQNALSQAKLFNEAVALTGLVLTKLDGTAKGGVIFALSKQLSIPIRFIGIGEGIDDLQDFDAESFVNALFAKD